MKFILTFDGDLKPNGGVKEKWEVRRQIHSQLQQLWKINPALSRLKRIERLIPAKTGFIPMTAHHSVDATRDKHIKPPTGETIDLIANIERGGRQFCPLVRESLALKCALKIIFLRKESAGKVYQGGDLDNRLKTLFDGLAVPNANQVILNVAPRDTVLCLLEDDSLITRLDVDTQRLLTNSRSSIHRVRLLIEVDIGVVQTRFYNHTFLGD
jgi:hypothetical protein